MSDVGEEDTESDLIEIDAFGEVDGDNFLTGNHWRTHQVLGARGNNDLVQEEIELSSDEEPDAVSSDDVSLLLLRRPPAIEPQQEAIDILDSDEEFPVYITEASKPENVNILEKKGQVVEYIENEGLGMIFAE